MYPDMIKAAKEEQNMAAQRSFAHANAVESIHASLYRKALDNMDGLEDTDYHVCSVCGYTCAVDAPESCPVCGSAKAAFVKVG